MGTSGVTVPPRPPNNPPPPTITFLTGRDWLPRWLWTPAPVFERVPAVCSRLSAAACYKACVICSAKCRPQTQGQLKATLQRHPVPPGPRCTQEAGAAQGPSVWPRSPPWPANAGVNVSRLSSQMSLVSLQERDDPSGPWESDWGFVLTDLFCLLSLTQVLGLCCRAH